MSTDLAAQAAQVVEVSTADACVAIATHTSSVNLRWANNTLTTNGAGNDHTLSVISIIDGRVGVVTRSAVADDDLADLVRQSEQAARGSEPAEDARPLVAGAVQADFADGPDRTDVGVFERFAVDLGAAFARARQEGHLLYGFAEHVVTTTWLATSTGTRRRHVQPGGSVAITAKSDDLARSVWAGRATRDFSDVETAVLHDELSQRLAWSATRVDLPAGRYETLLSPSATADLLVYAYWSAAGRDAAEGRSVFSRPGGGTRVGDVLSEVPLTLRSDPDAPGLGVQPFVATTSSDAMSSVFDNGLDLAAVNWVERGTLAALPTTRATAQTTGLALTPYVDNLLVSGGGDADLTAMIESTRGRALLVTCLWYIREVDPQTLLLTGLTRDGVFLIEDGAVVGAVNNYRFNESPVGMLARVSEAGRPVLALPREWGDYFELAEMPPLRVREFNMSSVSQAS